MERSKSLLRQDFDKAGFENLLFQNNILFTLEKAVYCPCRRKDNSSPQVECVNCNGSGWLFVHGREVNATVMSLNYDQKIQMTYTEITASANLTMSEDFENRLAFFDKLSMKDGAGITINNLARFEQITNEYKKIVFQLTLPYSIVSIEYLVIYLSNSENKILTPNDYTIVKSNVIQLNSALYDYLTKKGFIEIMASIRYNHLPIYHVMRSEHNIRMTKVEDNTTYMPLQYLIREHNFFVQNGFPL